MKYVPRPIDTSGQQLSEQLAELAERLAENAHEVWAAHRIAERWKPGPRRSDAKKTHPNLVSYGQLTESEKEYDRKIVIETMKAIQALGYRIEKKARSGR